MGMTAAEKRVKELEGLKAQLEEVKASKELSAEEIEAQASELEAKIAALEVKVAEDVAKAESKARKQVNLDEDMDRVHPTFATGIQAVMRDLIKNKGKK